MRHKKAKLERVDTRVCWDVSLRTTQHSDTQFALLPAHKEKVQHNKHGFRGIEIWPALAR